VAETPSSGKQHIRGAISQWQLTAERHEALAVAKHLDHRQQRRGREKPFLQPSFAVAIGSREGNALKQDERVAGPLIKKESGHESTMFFRPYLTHRN
jgi:hypothetical protein